MNALLPFRFARSFAALLLGLSAMLVRAQTPAPTFYNGEDWSFPYTVTPAPNTGLFRDNGAFPNLFIYHQQVHLQWTTLSPRAPVTGDDGFDFTSITSALSAAATGNYLVLFRLEVGTAGGSGDGHHMPTWVINNYSLSPNHIFRTQGTAGSSDEIKYGAPWHPGVQAEFRRLLLAMANPSDPRCIVNGKPIFAHPNFWGVLLHGCSGSQGEEATNAADAFLAAGGIDIASASATSTAGGHYATLGDAITTAWHARVGYWKEAIAQYTAAGWPDFSSKIVSVGGGSWKWVDGQTHNGNNYGNYDGKAFETFVINAPNGFGMRHGRIEYYFYGNLMPPKAGQSFVNNYMTSNWADPLRDGRFWGDENEENKTFICPTGVNAGNYIYYFANDPKGAGIPGPVRDLVSRSPFFRAAQTGMTSLWASPWAVRYACWNNPTENTTDCTPGGDTTLADNSAADSTNRARMPLWFTLVAGKGPATSPDAAVWLREATVGLIPGAPNPSQWKNMERMLMQRDIAGAMTVANEPQPMPKVDTKPDANYVENMARRTDVGATPTAQRSIAFTLDPVFRSSLGTQAVQIKITYRNSSSTTWKVRAARGSGTPLDLGSVTNGTDGMWKTATFTLAAANAPFNPGGAGSPLGDTIDFDINVPSGTTNNVTVRYVRVVRTADPTATLVGQWKLNETSGTTAADSSGLGNNGTLTNFAANPPWASGGLDFDGVDDLINAGSASSLDNLPSLSASAWIYADTLGEVSNGRIICKGGPAGPTFTGWRLLVQATNRVTFSADFQTAYLTRATVDNAITLGAWNHVAVTWDGSGTAANVHIYINGTEATYATTTNAPAGEARADDSTYNLVIGNDIGAARTFDGVLRDVRVYNGIISSSLITTLAQPAPVITTSSLPAGRTTISYGNQSLAASGGTTPYTWSVSAGSLPAGLSLSSAGVVSGTPTTAGTSNFTARVTDANGAFDDQPLAITITTNSVPNITTTTLPGATVGTAYNQNVASTGGDIAWTWSVSAGALPAGLTLGNVNSQTATISGTPTTGGTANFTLQLADVDNDLDTQALSIVVTDPIPAAPSGLGLTVISYNQINLAWTDNASNETSFRVERKTGAGGSYTEIGSTGANVTTYNDTNCGAGTLYYYRVRARNAAGDSAYCTEVSATSTEITSGRQGHWKLDETTGTTAADSSGNNNTGTLTSGPTHLISGKVGNGVNFDGVDDLINCGSGASLDNLAAITLSAWFKPNSLGETSNGRILSKGSTPSTFSGWRLLIQATNRIAFSVDYASNYMSQVTADNAVTLGAWNHVIVTWDGGATPSSTHIYVNGVEVSYGAGNTGTGTRANDSTFNLTIGNDISAAKTFDGGIDEVRVYNRVLSAAEITAVYRAGL